MSQISRKENASLFGPTVGDKIRLGDTDLYIEIEKDLRVYGDEAIYGGGKTLRDGMGMDNQLTSEGGALDLVITNVTVVDPLLGVIKADVGIKDGKIVGVGKAGNPGTMDGVTPGLTVGPATDAITAEHLILTPAGNDGHIHLISPQQVYAALSNGVTTFFGGGIGPTDGTNGTTITSGRWNIEMMLRAVEGLPINFGFLGKGNCSGEAPLVEQILAGAAGFKIHEDWGTTTATIRASLSVADDMDVQVCIHTDTLNEGGFVEDTIAAFEGRTIHTYHTEGAGGGHAPDIIKVAGELDVLPGSTNPTLPYGINTMAELFDMIMVCHNLNPKVPSDVAFAESRVRPETIAAENVLHDMGEQYIDGGGGHVSMCILLGSALLAQSAQADRHRPLQVQAGRAGLSAVRSSHLRVSLRHRDAVARSADERGKADESSPSWSPDGARIAFMSNRHEDPDREPSSQLFIVDAKKESTEKALTPDRQPRRARQAGIQPGRQMDRVPRR